MRPAVAALAVALALAACGGDDAVTTTGSATTAVPSTTQVTTSDAPVGSTTSTSVAPDTTATLAPTTGAPVEDGPVEDGPVTLLLPTAGAMDAAWLETLFLPYGDTEDTLGTSPGGEGIEWGPDYGTQAPDGTWWFLDGAKSRIAHFAADGTYLGATELAPDQLVDGRYFQFQMPQALDDGTVVASGLRPGGTELLIVAGDTIRLRMVDRELAPVTTDGTVLIGDDFAGGGRFRLDPSSGAVEDVDWLASRAGTRYGFQQSAGEIVIDLPDAASPVTRNVTLRWADEPTTPALVASEVETGPDGTLHVYLTGYPETDESVQLAGYFSVAPNGAITRVEASRHPSSPSDPGSPARLGVDPSSGIPWLMFVDSDGVRVFTRVG